MSRLSGDTATCIGIGICYLPFGRDALTDGLPLAVSGAGVRAIGGTRHSFALHVRSGPPLHGTLSGSSAANRYIRYRTLASGFAAAQQGPDLRQLCLQLYIG
jgi:hypothetical protein